MHSDWLAATNFERMHEVVSAINTLEIHAKLARAGVDDPAPESDIVSARTHLLRFLDQLADAVQEAERAANGLIMSSDPRLGELALKLLADGGQRDPRGRPELISPTALRGLIGGGDEESLQRVIPKLERLRTLIEEHMQEDVAGILGDESW